MKNNRVFIGIGSNLGDREQNLYNALRLMHRSPKINLAGTSPIYETEPVGINDHPDYLNMTAEITTTLEPLELLNALQDIEDELGRKGRGTMSPRIIDLDILLYGDQVFSHESLVIPHPRLTDRKFALQTLMDLDPDLGHPATGLTIQRHFEECSDTSRVELYRK
jgi:2-amino-4-hydroxy-6-hydroxymethyldihydropteridine diphosphokinase